MIMNKIGKYIVALLLLWGLSFWAALLCQNSYRLGVFTGEVRMLEKFVEEGVVKKEGIPTEFFGVNGRFKGQLVTQSLFVQGSEIALVIVSIFIFSRAVRAYREKTSNQKIKAD